VPGVTACDRLDESEEDEAKEKIENQAQVNAIRHMLYRGREMREQEEIDRVASQNRRESVEKIPHC
jgi:hypothetical protein